MKKHYLKLIMSIVSFVLLTGCAGMNSHFGCDAKAENSCRPVSEINAKAQAGAYNYRTSGGGGVQLPISQTFSYSNVSDSKGYQGTTPFSGEPVRAQERIQRIWIAPYQDSTNIYHEPSYIYTVLEASHWVGLPATAVQTTDTE